ncbi:MAG: hypothetical protein ACRCV4_03845 [Hafnia alvei]
MSSLVPGLPAVDIQAQLPHTLRRFDIGLQVFVAVRCSAQFIINSLA